MASSSVSTELQAKQEDDDMSISSSETSSKRGLITPGICYIFCKSNNLPVYLSLCVWIYLSVNGSMYISPCVSIFPCIAIYLYQYFSTYISVSLYIYVSICISTYVLIVICVSHAEMFELSVLPVSSTQWVGVSCYPWHSDSFTVFILCPLCGSGRVCYVVINQLGLYFETSAPVVEPSEGTKDTTSSGTVRGCSVCGQLLVDYKDKCRGISGVEHGCATPIYSLETFEKLTYIELLYKGPWLTCIGLRCAPDLFQLKCIPAIRRTVWLLPPPPSLVICTTL